MNAPRFANLQAELSALRRPPSPERIAQMVRAGNNPSPAPPAAPSSSAAAPKPAAAAKPKAENKPTAAPWSVPAEIAAQGEAKSEAYRMSFELVTDRLRRAAALPAAKGRIGALMTMIAEGMTDEQIAAKVPNAKTDRQAAIDATWDGAIAQIFGTGAKTAAPARGGRASVVWDAAIAAVCA